MQSRKKTGNNTKAVKRAAMEAMQLADAKRYVDGHKLAFVVVDFGSSYLSSGVKARYCSVRFKFVKPNMNIVYANDLALAVQQGTDIGDSL